MIKLSRIAVPKSIWIEGEYLRCDWRGATYVNATRPGLLEGFLKIETASPEQILRYARGWGMLELCETHGLPYFHNGPACSDWWESEEISSTAPWEVVQLSGCGRGDREPLEEWRKYARRANALLRMNRDLRLGKQARPEDGALIVPAWPDVSSALWARRSICAYVADWTRLGNVRQFPVWTGSAPTLQFAVNGVFGAIAVQLMMQITGAATLVICDGCGRGFSPKRRPRPDRKTFCAGCRKAGIPGRLRQQEYRDRKRDAKQTDR